MYLFMYIVQLYIFVNLFVNCCPKTAKVTINVGLAAKRLRATVNLGSNKKKAWLDNVDQAEGVDQGQGLDQEPSGFAEDTVPVCTEKQRGEDVFGNEFPEFEALEGSEGCFESLLDNHFLSSSTAHEITIVDEVGVDKSSLEDNLCTLDENENPPKLKQVLEKEKKPGGLVSFGNHNELRMKEMERMRLLEEVKKRVGGVQISKK